MISVKTKFPGEAGVTSQGTMLCRIGLLSWACVLTASEVVSQTTQTTPASSFPAEVELVTVDAVVLDKVRNPVTGLAREDFRILQDGVPQTITSFEAVDVSAAPAMERRAHAKVSSNALPETSRGRTFVLVFDNIHLTPAQAHRAKGAIGEFLKSGVREGDRLTLLSTGGEAWWSATMPEGRDQLMAVLKRLDGRYVTDPSPDRLTEYEALRIEVYQDESVARQVGRRFDTYGAIGRQRPARGPAPPDARTGEVGIVESPVRIRAAEVYRASVARNKITLGAVERAIRSLAGVRGRKTLVLVSQGFVYDLQDPDMRQVVDASRRGNVPIYFVNTRGLQGLPEAMTASFGPAIDIQDFGVVLADMTLESQGAESLALDTGGFVVRNTNDLSAGLARISRESQAYYLLGYSAGAVARDGRFHRIEVQMVVRKGVEVRARRGYFAPLPTSQQRPSAPADLDPAVESALDSPFEKREVPLRTTAYVFDETMLGRANVTLIAEAAVDGLAFVEREGRYCDTLEFRVTVQQRDGGESVTDGREVEMALLPATRERLLQTWYPITSEFQLIPGAYQARIVVRDRQSGRVGSVIHDFEVPSLDGLRVSSPILTDAVQEGTADSRPGKPVLLARRTFPAGFTLFCQYQVYGAKKDEQTNMPSVTASYVVRRRDGTLVKSAEATRVTPTSLGALLRLLGLDMSAAEPGEYDLVLSVRDVLAGTAVELVEAFEVVPAGSTQQ